MDKDRLKRLCETVLETSYSGVTITEFDMTPTFKYDDELSKWVPNSFTLFIQVKTSEFPRNIQSTLEGYIGLECCVDFL
jgi:hypothetical protein